MIDHAAARDQMVVEQIEARGVRDPAVLMAIRSVPRHRFIPPPNRDLAYHDGPVSIGEGQTISQPYLVAMMSEALHIRPGMRVSRLVPGLGTRLRCCARSAHVCSVLRFGRSSPNGQRMFSRRLGQEMCDSNSAMDLRELPRTHPMTESS